MFTSLQAYGCKIQKVNLVCHKHKILSLINMPANKNHWTCRKIPKKSSCSSISDRRNHSTLVCHKIYQTYSHWTTASIFTTCPATIKKNCITGLNMKGVNSPTCVLWHQDYPRISWFLRRYLKAYLTGEDISETSSRLPVSADLSEICRVVSATSRRPRRQHDGYSVWKLWR